MLLYLNKNQHKSSQNFWTGQAYSTKMNNISYIARTSGIQ